MALKVLTGILVTRGHSEGNATIHFDPHRVTGTIDLAHKTDSAGPPGRFNNSPCKMVAVREFSFRESGEGRTHFPRSYKCEINDTTITRDHMEIEWRGHNVNIEEISYMIIGEVPDPE